MTGICFLLACLMAFSVGLYGQEALTIDDIIGMVNAKLRSRSIVQKVNLSSMESAPSVEDIVRLKKAGASRRVIDAVFAAPVTGPSEIPATSSTMPSPEPWTTSSEPSSGGLEKGAYSKFEVLGLGLEILVSDEATEEELIELIHTLAAGREHVNIRVYSSQEAYRQGQRQTYGEAYKSGYLLFYIKNLTGRGPFEGLNEIRWMQEKGHLPHKQGELMQF